MVKIKAKDIAQLINRKIVGNKNAIIQNLNRIENSNVNDLTFVADQKYVKFLEVQYPSCVIIFDGAEIEPKKDQAFIISPNPYNDFVEILKYFDSLRKKPNSFIHPTAVIGEECDINPSAYIGPYCVIGNEVVIGENTILKSHVVLYDSVNIGADTIIYSNTTICSETIIGDNCIIHPGVVIGADGFGYLEDKEDGSYDKIPQLGRVVIKDDVEIGANTTIDRALIGDTVIGSGVKIDNLVQIGHNCSIGENSAIVAQAGIAGSVNIGKRNRIGGQVGLAGHLSTTDDVILMAQSGVSKSIENKGIYFGAPAKDQRRAFRIEASIRQLPDMVSEFRDLKRKLNKLDL